MESKKEEMAWLRFNAPEESARPWEPIETSLLDPDVLQPAPPLHARLGAAVSWAASNPVAMVCFVVGAGCCFGSVMLAVGPVFYLDSECSFATCVRALSVLAGLNALNLVVARYKLYYLATQYQVHKGATLGNVTTLRLRFRATRGMALVGLAVVAGVLAWRRRPPPEAGCDRLCCPGQTGSSSYPPERIANVLDAQLVLTVAALPFLYAVLFKFGRDPVEEAAIRQRMAQHQHTSS